MQITKAKVTRIFRWLQEQTARVVLLFGGSGSSKSYSLAQHIILDIMLKQNLKRILIVRKTRPAVKLSCYQLFLDLLDEYGVKFGLHKTELRIRVGSNEVIFMGFDDISKLKSIEFCNYIWVEEATEISFEEFKQLDLRLRRKSEHKNRMWLTCNPISSLHWIKRKLVDRPIGSLVIHASNYKDNPFLDADYVATLEDLVNQDENFFMIYALGQWGVLKNIIYHGYKLVDLQNISYFLPEKQQGDAEYKVTDITYGFDYGFNRPSALVQVFWLENGKFIWHELLYASHLQNNQLIDALKKHIPNDMRKHELFVDPSEQGFIKLASEQGFNVHNAKNAVKDGIDYCKVNLLGITLASVNTASEAQVYSYMEDKDGNVQENPVKINDHAMDAGRYGSFSKARFVSKQRTIKKAFR